MASVLRIHERDPNFPHNVLLKIQEFLGMAPPPRLPHTGPL